MSSKAFILLKKNPIFQLLFFSFISYYCSYLFKGEYRTFLLNGHTGKCHGERPPLGLGKLGDVGKGVKNMFTTISGKKEHESIYKGEDLNKKDQVTVYFPHLFYLTFSRSDSFLFTESVGQIKLRNEGNKPVSLEAQKRRSAQKAFKIHVLNPGEEVTFPYKGHWCFAVASGDPFTVRIVELKTKSSEKLEDILGMAN